MHLFQHRRRNLSTHHPRGCNSMFFVSCEDNRQKLRRNLNTLPRKARLIGFRFQAVYLFYLCIQTWNSNSNEDVIIIRCKSCAVAKETIGPRPSYGQMELWALVKKGAPSGP
jgi:predicted nucleic acid binding AN1-type Zn finger protein